MGLSQMPSQIPQTAFSSPESRPVQLDTYGREPYTYFDTVTYQGGLPPQYSYQPDVPLVGTLPTDTPRPLFSNA